MVSLAYFIAGAAGNACQAAVNAPTVSPAEDSLFPASNLITGFPWEEFRYGSAPTDPYIRFDLNQVKNGSFESDADGEDPTDWVQEAGSPQVSNAQADAGSVSLALDDSESAYQDLEVVAGNRYRLEFALHGNASGGEAAVRLIHLDSQQYKTTASETSYSTSATNLATKSTTGWATTSQDFVVPTQVAGASDRTIIRIQALKTNAAGADVYVDDFRLYPDVDFASLHFVDRFGTTSAWNIISSDNNWSSQTTEDSLPARGYRSFVKFTPANSTPRQYWGFEATGTFFRKPRFGQFVMGEAVSLTRTSFRPAITRTMPQVVVDSDVLRLVANRAPDPRVTIPLRFRTTDAGRQQLEERLVGGSRHGAELLMVVPDDARPNEVFLGKVAGELTYSRGAGDIYTVEVPFREEAFPVGTK